MRYPTSKASSDFSGKNSKEQPFPTTLRLETCKIHKMLLKFCISYTDDPSTTSGCSPVTAHQAEPARFNCPLPCSDSSEHQGSSWITAIGTSEFKPGKPAPSPAWNSLGNENQLFSPHSPLPGVTLRTTVPQKTPLHGHLMQYRWITESLPAEPKSKTQAQLYGIKPRLWWYCFYAEIFTFRQKSYI